MNNIISNLAAEKRNLTVVRASVDKILVDISLKIDDVKAQPKWDSDKLVKLRDLEGAVADVSTMLEKAEDDLAEAIVDAL